MNKKRQSENGNVQTAKTQTKPSPKKPTAKQQAILTVKNNKPDMKESEIAIATGTSQSYVSEVLQKYGLIEQSVQEYKDNKADIWAGITSKILSSISDEDIQKASLQQKLTSAGISHDKEMDITGGKREVAPMVIINKISIGKVEDNQANCISVSK
jgi:hypothetical protein